MLFLYILCRCFARLQRETSRNFLVARFMEEMSYVFSFNFFFTARSFSPCIGGHWHFPFCHRRYKIFMLFFQQKKCLLCFLSLTLDLCRPFSRWASLACCRLSLFLYLSPALFSKFVATREKKNLWITLWWRKKDNKRNAGDFKKTELKKFPFPSLFILIDRCPSRPLTMTATATSRNVNYLP